MFNAVAYVTPRAWCNIALQELKCYKAELVAWAKKNGLEHWTMSKFGKEQWGRMDSNMIRSLNN